MSLRLFHMFFITLASLLSLGGGVLLVMDAAGNALMLVGGIASLVAGVALLVYGFAFLRKTRELPK